MKSLLWLVKATLQTTAGNAVLSVLLLAGLGLASAASWDVANEVQMNLDVALTPTKTTGIVIASPQRNGANHVFATTSGGILRIRSGAYVEDIYFASATRNATTNKVTLAGVVRNICPQYFTSIVSCGDGRSWGKGAIVELTQDARLFNLKANVDRSNTFTAREGVQFSGSGSLGQPTFATTAARDQQLGATPAAGSGLTACVVATGLCYDGLGGAWVARAAGTTANAEETVAGKVQIGTLDMLLNRTMTGSTGAQNALAFRWIVKNGSGAGTAGYVVQTGNNGAISPSLGGTGLAGATQSGVLVGNGSKNSMLQITASSGQVLRANAKGSWFASTLSPTLVQWNQPNEKLTNSAGDQNFTTTYAIPAAISTGSVIIIEATGTGASTGASYRYGLKLGSTEVCAGNSQDAGNDNAYWKLEAKLQLKKNGVGGLLETLCTITGGSTVTSSGSTVAINTSSPNTVNVLLRSNGTTAYSYLTNLFVTTFSR